MSVICGAVSAVIGLPAYNVGSEFWYINAIIWGLGWSDILANVATLIMGKVKK